MLGRGLSIALLVLVLDQGSKWLAMRALADGPLLILPGFFDLTLVHNLGAAFGLFTGLSDGWREGFLMAVGVGASVVLSLLLRTVRRWWEAVALALILGGALGNLIDRLRWGWVVDFIHVHWHDLSWPVFNVADSAITVGVAMLLWDNLIHHKSRPDET